MWAALRELLVPSVCAGCDAARRAGEALLCRACARGLRPLPALGSALTAIAYEGSGAVLVRRFKYEARGDALEVVAALLTARLAGLRFDGIVPLPRHPRRVRELGFDPVHALARSLARATGAPLLDGVLRRTRPTRPQTALGPRERRANVEGSFRAARDGLRGRRPLLLDDVTTTGATLAEAARTLAQQGGARPPLRAAVAGTPALSASVLSLL